MEDLWEIIDSPQAKEGPSKWSFSTNDMKLHSKGII